MPDYLDDDVVDMLYEMGRKSLAEERDLRRRDWLKKYQIDINRLFFNDFFHQFMFYNSSTNVQNICLFFDKENLRI